jgi:hypothetical protein
MRGMRRMTKGGRACLRRTKDKEDEDAEEEGKRGMGIRQKG